MKALSTDPWITRKAIRRLAVLRAAALTAALVAGSTACSTEPVQPRPSNVALPTAAYTAELLEPAAGLSRQDTFSLGAPVISQRGMGSGSYLLPPRRKGQTLTVAASCTGPQDVSISTRKGPLTRATCSLRAGNRFSIEISADQPADRISVAVGRGQQYWLDVFITDAPIPKLSAPASAKEAALQAWSLEAVKPQGIELVRLINSGQGEIHRTINVAPGTYRWSISCRGTGDVSVTVVVGGSAGNTASCGGAVSSVVTVAEPTALSLTMSTNRVADRTLVLARAAGS